MSFQDNDMGGGRVHADLMASDSNLPESPEPAIRPKLVGRDRECAALERLVTGIGEAGSQILVLRGEAGIGKSALLDHLETRASGHRVLRAGGVQAEVELAYAGLQQLCAPMVDHIEALPQPQGEALANAMGLCDGDPPDPFLVGLGVRSVLVEVASERPLFCLIDDFQWLDKSSAETLGFVARRLQRASVAMIFAARPFSDDTTLFGLPDLRISGLNSADSRSLFESALLAPLDPEIADQLLAEMGGNPHALLELPRILSPAELSGGFRLPGALPIDSRLETSLRRRMAALPAETRELLLLAAADPLGDPVLMWQAAHLLGVEPSFAEAASGLLEVGPRVRFRNLDVRATVYSSASGEARRRVHRALADATSAGTDPDRAAWHRAAAASGPDENVALELERATELASSRGGAAAAAAFLARAVELSAKPIQRGARAVAAARRTIDVGAPEVARELLRVAESSPLTDGQRSQLERLRAELASTVSRGGETPALLLRAARRLELLDVGLARSVYLEAFSAAHFAGRLAIEVNANQVAEAARALSGSGGPRRPPDLLLDAVAVRCIDGLRAAAPLLRRALRAFQSPGLLPDEALRCLFCASTAAIDLWDEDTWEDLSNLHLQLARHTGTLSVLPLALLLRIALHACVGDLAGASDLVRETNAVAAATGARMAPYGELFIAAWRGQDKQSQLLVASTEQDATARGEGFGLSTIEWLGALHASAAGHYVRSLELAQLANAYSGNLGVSTWALIEVVEASSRLGDIDNANDGLRRLSESTSVAGTKWALGVQERSSALVSDGKEAEEHYQAAIELLEQSRMRPELARSHLVYGEWLRRSNRRADARRQLRTAHDLFISMGVDGFAERTRRELNATGETVRKRSVDTALDLTPQEQQIAALAADFQRNSEIASQLFLSPRTVEWHLRKVFTKLGVSSRRELRALLEHESKSLV